MRLFGYIALFLSLAYAFALYVKSKIKLTVSLDRLDLAGLVVSAIQRDLQPLRTFFNINIKNENAFNISFSDLDIMIFYNGVLVARSATISATRNIILPKLDEDFSHALDVTLSKQLFQALKALKDGQPLTLQYIVKVKLFGIPLPFTFKDDFEYIIT